MLKVGDIVRIIGGIPSSVGSPLNQPGVIINIKESKSFDGSGNITLYDVSIAGSSCYYFSSELELDKEWLRDFKINKLLERYGENGGVM